MKVKTIYDRPHLEKLLSATLDHPVTLVCAGAGFGKTTTVREYLRKANVPFAWVPLTDGDTAVFWEKLIDAIEPHGSKAADEMRVQGIPEGAWEVSRAVKIAKEYCKSPFIIAIDDYQHLPEESPVHALLETLAFEEIENLHLLILSRTEPNIRVATLESKDLCLRIGADDLRFDERETKGYLAMRGLRLTKSAVTQIHQASDGWISAIYLLSEGVRSGGSIRQKENIDALFSENLMPELSAEESDMLYRLSAFDVFPLEMAVTALGMEQIRELVDRLMHDNAFITRDDMGLYRFHPLFRDYLLPHCPEDEAQKRVYRRTGLWYLNQGTFPYQGGFRSTFTVDLFVKGDCVDGFLEYMDKPDARRMNYCDLPAIGKLAMSLPDEKCLAYPFSYLQIIFYMVLSGEKRYLTFATHLIAMMHDRFFASKDPRRDRILGELLVISRVAGFGSFSTESEPLEEAARLLHGRPSVTLNPADPFTFGLPMLLHSEYMHAGALDEAVQRCQYNPYELVADEFGRGSEALVRAEAALLRSQMDEAQICAVEAIEEATNVQQFFIEASGRSVLMRRALFLGDVEGAAAQVDDLRDMVAKADRALSTVHWVAVTSLRTVLMLAECFLATSLGCKDDIPGNFLDTSYKSDMVAGLGVPQAYMARALYKVGNYASAERVCAQLPQLPAVCQCARIYGYILTGLSREKLYGPGGGVPAMRKAIEQAQSDGVILPFAENPEVLEVLSKVKLDNGIDAEFVASVKQHAHAYAKVAPVAVSTPVASLSKREVEVLRLTAEGKTRKEVAEQLGVRSDTVKKHLSNAYRKLDASNKTEAIRAARTNHLF